MPKVGCPSHQVYYKNSKKCINIGSDEFQKVLEKDLFAFDAYTKKIEKFFASKNNAPKCPDKKVYNKYTKRCVIINSQSYYKALKDHPDVFDDQKDKISKMFVTKIKKNINPKLLIPKVVLAPTQNSNKMLKTKNLKPHTPTQNSNKVLKTKIPVKKNIKDILTKLLKNKMKNAPSKYFTKKIPVNTINTIELLKGTKITYNLPYRPYAYIDIHRRKLNKAKLKYMTYTVDSTNDRYFKNVLNIDVSKELIDLKWYYNCQKYIDNLTPKEKWALKGYSYKGDVYVNLTERNIKIDYNNFSLTPFVYEFFEMILDGEFEDKAYDKDTIKKLLNKPSDELSDLSNKFTTSIISLGLKKRLIEKFNNTLTNVIKKSPVVTTPMTVFRGIKDSFFTKSDYKNNKVNELYINKGYVSTSMNWSASMNNFTGFGCCFSVITILPGTRCLPLLGISNFLDEMEILLNKDTKFLIRRKFEAPKTASLTGKIKFSHIIVT